QRPGSNRKSSPVPVAGTRVAVSQTGGPAPARITFHEQQGRRMATKGTIGTLTGGGDVPGLNPAIRAITIRALREGYRVLGIRRGWAGLSDLVRDPEADNSANVQVLTEDIVNRAARTGGTFLHTSRTRPSFL